MQDHSKSENEVLKETPKLLTPLPQTTVPARPKLLKEEGEESKLAKREELNGQDPSHPAQKEKQNFGLSKEERDHLSGKGLSLCTYDDLVDRYRFG